MRMMAVKMFDEFIVRGRNVSKRHPGVFISGETLPAHEVFIALTEFAAVEDADDG